MRHSVLGVDELVEALIELLPPGPPLFTEDEISDLPVKFFVEEFIREQITKKTGEEIPYKTTVVVESFNEQERSSADPGRHSRGKARSKKHSDRKRRANDEANWHGRSEENRRIPRNRSEAGLICKSHSSLDPKSETAERIPGYQKQNVKDIPATPL